MVNKYKMRYIHGCFGMCRRFNSLDHALNFIETLSKDELQWMTVEIITPFKEY